RREARGLSTRRWRHGRSAIRARGSTLCDRIGQALYAVVHRACGGAGIARRRLLLLIADLRVAVIDERVAARAEDAACEQGGERCLKPVPL
ncbi:MAG TPA: hypothetical protein VIV57_16160, partial [Anaeromyxobacter sp.]